MCNKLCQLNTFDATLYSNAVHKSGEKENVHTRLMTLDNQQVIWEHIIELFKAERHIGWTDHRLTAEAVYLNSFSKMRINLMEKVRVVP